MSESEDGFEPKIITFVCNWCTYVGAELEWADDVLNGRCHPGDCHYLNGNYQVQRRVDILKEILKGVGMDENRV